MREPIDRLQQDAEVAQLILRSPLHHDQQGLVLELHLVAAGGDKCVAIFRGVNQLVIKTGLGHLPVTLEIVDNRDDGWENRWLVTDVGGEDLLMFRSVEFELDGVIF